jgi:hypothetical protein
LLDWVSGSPVHREHGICDWCLPPKTPIIYRLPF